MGIIASILAFSFLIIVHEFGHLITAKRLGVKVETFALGMGKPFIKFNWHGTDYGIAPFPLGGYCKMKGEKTSILEGPSAATDLLEEEELRLAPDSYSNKPFWKKAIILVSGSAMNLLSAFLILLLLSMFYIKVPLNTPVVGSVMVGSAAAAAGVEPNDRFVGYLDPVTKSIKRDFATFSDLTKFKVAGVTTYLLDRNGKEMTVELVTVPFKDSAGKTLNILGIRGPTRQPTLSESVKKAGSLYAGSVGALRDGFMMLFSKNSTIPKADMVSGPIGIVKMTSKIADSAVVAGGKDDSLLADSYMGEFFFMWALISINLGIVNLLPIPPLDGGNIVIEALSPWIRKYRPLRLTFKYASIMSVVLLLGVMLVATTNDVLHLFQ